MWGRKKDKKKPNRQARFKDTLPSNWYDCGNVTHQEAAKALVRRCGIDMDDMPVTIETREDGKDICFDHSVSVEEVIHVKSLRHDEDSDRSAAQGSESKR